MLELHHLQIKEMTAVLIFHRVTVAVWSCKNMWNRKVKQVLVRPLKCLELLSVAALTFLCVIVMNELRSVADCGVMFQLSSDELMLDTITVSV